MEYRRPCISGLLAAMALGAWPAAAHAQGAARPFVSNELLVKWDPAALTGANDSFHNKLGAKLLATYNSIDWQRVRVPPGMAVADAIAKYRALPGVTAAEPNYLVTLGATPNDTLYPSLYGLPKVSAPAAWDLDTGINSVVVAVVDSGISYSHADLAANMWHNPGEIAGNGIDDDGDGYVDDVYGIAPVDGTADPVDTQGHGTWVAGTIGAVGNNGQGVTGVLWNVKLMALKFTNQQATGAASDAVTCIQYATLMRQRGVNVRVINASWATGSSQALQDALTAAGNAGILTVCAAMNTSSNNDTSPVYPGNYSLPSLMTVAASDASDNLASFSNWGPTTVHIAAPGVNIQTTSNTGLTAYAYSSGTSFSAAYVAGAAAMLFDYQPAMTPPEAKALLMDTADKLPQWTNLVVSGGRLNLARAMAVAPLVVVRRVGYDTMPGGAPAGAPLSPQPIASFRDSAGNTVHGYTGAITLSIKSGTGTAGAHLTGTVTVSAVNGVATFTNVAVDTPGTGYVLVASSGGLTTASSNPFNVTLPATALAFTASPTGGVAGISVSPVPSVKAVDANGATVTAFNGPVTIAISPNTGTPGATLSGTTTVAAVNGVAAFPDLAVSVAGSGYVLSASSSGLTGANSAAFDVGQAYTMDAIEALRVVRGTVAASGTITSGTGFTVQHVTDSGVYHITFTKAFASGDLPVVVASAFGANPATINGVNPTNAAVDITVYVAGTAADRSFGFVVVGAK
ncbi:MAG TPA: S8 family serine peptidase [Armatimonadota bacterium]